MNSETGKLKRVKVNYTVIGKYPDDFEDSTKPPYEKLTLVDISESGEEEYQSVLDESSFINQEGACSEHISNNGHVVFLAKDLEGLITYLKMYGYTKMIQQILQRQRNRKIKNIFK